MFRINPGGALISRIQIIAVAVSVFLILVVFQLIRRKKLKEQYSLLWFLTVMVILALALWDRPLLFMSRAVGIATPSNLLFLMAMIFLFVMAMHFSLLVSRLTDQSKMLAQKVALLDRDLRKARKESGNSPPDNVSDEQA
ncbi:MAG: DUF2304 domain-containing protein [Thermoleophilia bacterium]|nr:DUF2304 domain-containing protein [Thermoleophilia bacterium]